jgi:hypothetical protein
MVEGLCVVTGDQIRAARKLLGWSRGRLVIRARGVTTNTVGKITPGTRPRRNSLPIRAALEAAGVEFTNGDESGVKLWKATEARKQLSRPEA